MAESELEAEFERQWYAVGLPDDLESGKMVHPNRKFRADFALSDYHILIEIEGGTLVFGRHNRAAGYEEDMRKYNLATMEGWRVFRFSSKQVRSGEGVAFMVTALNRIRADLGLAPLAAQNDPLTYDGTTTVRQWERRVEKMLKGR